jgi:hypothetical protein
MSAAPEQFGHVSAPAATDPVAPARRYMTAEQWEAAGHDALAMAREREEADGLQAAVPLYQEANRAFKNVIWYGRTGDVRSPHTMLGRAESLTKQVEAMDTADTLDIRDAELKDILQGAASQELQAAITALREQGRARVNEGPVTDEATLGQLEKIIAGTAVEAAIESGTGEHVVLYGIGEVGAGTAERLQAGGEDRLMLFIGENAMQPGQGPRFIEEMVERVEDRLDTGVHELPLAA